MRDVITHDDYVNRRGEDFRVRLFVCLSICLYHSQLFNENSTKPQLSANRLKKLGNRGMQKHDLTY